MKKALKKCRDAKSCVSRREEFLISQAKRRKILRLYLDDIEQHTYSIITIYYCELIVYNLMNYSIKIKVII